MAFFFNGPANQTPGDKRWQITFSGYFDAAKTNLRASMNLNIMEFNPRFEYEIEPGEDGAGGNAQSGSGQRKHFTIKTGRMPNDVYYDFAKVWSEFALSSYKVLEVESDPYLEQWTDGGFLDIEIVSDIGITSAHGRKRFDIEIKAKTPEQ